MQSVAWACTHNYSEPAFTVHGNLLYAPQLTHMVTYVCLHFLTPTRLFEYPPTIIPMLPILSVKM